MGGHPPIGRKTRRTARRDGRGAGAVQSRARRSIDTGGSVSVHHGLLPATRRPGAARPWRAALDCPLSIDPSGSRAPDCEDHYSLRLEGRASRGLGSCQRRGTPWLAPVTVMERVYGLLGGWGVGGPMGGVSYLDRLN